MADITGGKILYGRVRKDDDFGINRKAECELSFSLAEDDVLQTCLKKVADTAIEIVHNSLQMQGARAGKTVTTVDEVQQPATAAKSDKDKLAEAAIAGEAKPKATRAKKPPVAEADPLADEPAEKKETAGDDLGDLDDLMSPTATVITDADLQNKVMAVNAVIKNPMAIRDVIAKYVQKPKGAKDIPQELRSKFFADLDGLKPAA